MRMHLREYCLAFLLDAILMPFNNELSVLRVVFRLSLVAVLAQRHCEVETLL